MPSPVGTGRSCVQAGGVGWEGSNRKQGCSESPSRALAVVMEAQYLIEGLHSEACGGDWASQA